MKNAKFSKILLYPLELCEIMYAGLTFVVTGFDEEDKNGHEETIVTLGGHLVSKTYSGIPDYGVVPVQGACLKYTVNEIVTDLFIVSNYFISISYLFIINSGAHDRFY